MPITRRKFLWRAAGGTALVAAGYAGFKLSQPSLLQKPGKSRAETIETTTIIPDQADVAVIGAGIAGVMTALALVEKGYKVVILEKGVVAGEQSSRAFGWISSLGDSPARLQLAYPTQAIWSGLADRLNIDPTYRKNGLLYQCADDAAVAKWEKWANDNRELGGNAVRILRGSELEAKVPDADRNWHAGVFHPNDGSIEPPVAVPRIAQALRARGVTIVENCAVRSIETSGGSVSSVITEKGEIKCGGAVLAGGAWSRLFLQSNNIDLPILRVYSFQLRIPRFEGGPIGSGLGSGTVWRQDLSGGYSLGVPMNLAPVLPDNIRFLSEFSGAVSTNWSNVKLVLNHDFLNELFLEKSWRSDAVTPFERQRILSPIPNHDLATAGLESFQNAFPAAKNVQIAEEWGGVIDMTPDTAPIIQKIDQIPGLVFVGGMSGHGLSMAPAAGQLAAELLVNDTSNIVDPKLYNASRF